MLPASQVSTLPHTTLTKGEGVELILHYQRARLLLDQRRIQRESLRCLLHGHCSFLKTAVHFYGWKLYQPLHTGRTEPALTDFAGLPLG